MTFTDDDSASHGLNPFTDSDLKRLKEYIDDGKQTVWYAPADPESLKALIARLEAAEDCAEVFVSQWPEDVGGKDWRKKAGK